MKKSAFALLLLSISFVSSAQNIYRVTLGYDGRFGGLSLLSAQENVTINLSPEGTLTEWGTEYRSERVSDWTRLEKYLGRTEYYMAADNEAYRGKVKYIGNTAITYYASYEDSALHGKVKSIGTLQIEYYRPYEDATQRGKIKTIGRTELSYFSGFDNEALRGKLRSLGMINLSYYPSFEDKAFRGKIKTIGTVNFAWYSSFDLNYAGSLKNGQQSVYVNGINFFLKY